MARSQDVAQRRVIIKARVVRSNVMVGGEVGAGGRGGGLAAHVSYVERDGVSRDGAEGDPPCARRLTRERRDTGRPSKNGRASGGRTRGRRI